MVGYATGTRVKSIYIGKFMRVLEDKAVLSFMDRRPADTWVFPKFPKVEPVTLDQILVGPLAVAYDNGIIVRGLPDVKTKWGEYIKAMDDDK